LQTFRNRVCISKV